MVFDKLDRLLFRRTWYIRGQNLRTAIAELNRGFLTTAVASIDMRPEQNIVWFRRPSSFKGPHKCRRGEHEGIIDVESDGLYAMKGYLRPWSDSQSGEKPFGINLAFEFQL